MPTELLLPYPLIQRGTVTGVVSEEYEIPEEERAAVLEQMYPFEVVPDLDNERLDIQCDKRFRVGDFKVVRESGLNYLVSPFYYEGGGTVADWFPVEDENDA